jgi:hypothetical protein
MGKAKPAVAIHGYGAACLYKYQNKKVEVNCGETAITMIYNDHTLQEKSVVRGVLKDVIGDALVLLCDVPGFKQKEVLVNCWCVTSVTSFDGTGSTKNVYYDEGSKRLRRK